MSEFFVRLTSFAAIFALVGFLEWKYPFRQLACRKGFRWLNNMGLVVIDSLALRILLPVLAVGVAEHVYSQEGGLLGWLNMPLWLAAPLGFLLLDLAIYAQHWASHNVLLLWRLHRMHHADLDFDVSTALRFHPIEIVGSMVYKIALVWALGIHPAVVLVFEIVLNGTALFNHANFSIPAREEKVIRWFVVTPDMHRVHHSIRPEETNSNYGFNFPWWDRLFGTYVAQPKGNPQTMPIGIELFRTESDSALHRLLIQPFK
jgi:sterol desaturase/sphingolipid hydroxylase (fatty acid hydroxylase superfamily)